MSLKGGAAQAATALLEAGLVALESSNSKLAMHHVSATAPLIGHLIVEADPGTSALLERVAEAAGAARRDGVWCFPPRHEPLEACVLQSLLHAVRVADQSSAAASPASQPTPTDDCIQSPSESGARKRARPAEEEEEGRGSRSHLDLGRARASMQTQEGAAAAASAEPPSPSPRSSSSPASSGFYMFDFVPEAVVELERHNHTILRANKAFEQLLAPQERVLGLSLVEDLIQEGDRARVRAVIDNLPRLRDVANASRVQLEEEFAGVASEQEAGAFAAGTSDDGHADMEEALALWRVGKEQSTERHVKTLALRACKKARAPVWCAYDWAFVRAGPEEQANLYAIGCPGMSLAEAQDHEAEADRDWMTCLDLAPVALHWVGDNGAVIWANRSTLELMGMAPEEFVGRSLAEFVETEDQERLREAMRRAFAGESLSAVSVRLKVLGGLAIPRLLDINTRRSVDGKFRNAWCFLRSDVQQIMQKERALLIELKQKEIASQKEALLRKLMHEIRTPCHEICSSAEQLLETVIMSDDDAVEVRQVKASSIRLSDVLEDMADTVMFERNMVPKIDNVPFDLRAALQQIVDVMTQSYGREGVVVTLETNLGSRCVRGDQHCVQRVVRHMLKNSLSATKEGCIKIRAFLVDGSHDRIRISIFDTAGGVDADAIRKQMVNPWRECSDVLDAKSLGLGLHICHLVLQVLGSELHIESQDGSSEFSFTLTMPLEATSTAETTKVVRQTSYQRPDQERQKKAMEDTSDSLADTKKEEEAAPLQVLVVEDNKISQMCATRMLQSLGFVAEGADNGQIALDKMKARNNPYHLIIMDLRMPVMDGLVCTNAIRQELKLDVPIIAFTADATRDIKQKCFDVGMNGFLSKPVTNAGMRCTVEDILKIKCKPTPRAPPKTGLSRTPPTKQALSALQNSSK